MTRVAAIDCGTNSIRLLVADTTDGTLADVERRLEIVRLGQGVDRTGRLAPEAIERTRRVLAEYTDAIHRHGAERVRMVATSATRDAANREDFHAMVRATLGRPADVVTGDEEAALSFAGAVRGLAGGRPPFLVIDIGGGSTEFVLGDGCGVRSARSVDIGCVRLTERHLVDDPPTERQIAGAEADVHAALRLVRRTVPVDAAATVIGVAGTVTTVAAIAMDLPAYDPERIHGTRLSPVEIGAVSRRLLAMRRRDRAAIPSMHPGRVDVIGAGSLILRVLAEDIAAAEVVVSEHDILDGIAYSLLDT